MENVLITLSNRVRQIKSLIRLTTKPEELSKLQAEIDEHELAIVILRDVKASMKTGRLDYFNNRLMEMTPVHECDCQLNVGRCRCDTA